METYDVVVVGAGPAGSTAAYYIDGLKTLVVDRYDFPRHKACGGGLMSVRDWHLEFENFAKIEKSITSAYSNFILRIYWHQTFITARRFKHFFDQVNRSEFDHLLLQETLKKENVSFRKFTLRTMSRGTLGGKNGYFLSDGEREIFASFVIGADGMLSKVAQFLGNKPRERHMYGTCLEYDIACEKISDDVSVSMGYGSEIGYGWIFPTQKGYYVGIGMVREPRRVMQEYLDEYLAWLVEKGQLPKHHTITRTVGAMLPLRVVQRYCSDGVLLCGDAMGSVNILIGEGIYFAMKSGKIAGQTLSTSRGDLRRRYKENIRSIARSIAFTVYIPPKIFTITFWTIFFRGGKPFENLNMGWFNVCIHFFTRRILHRKPWVPGSYYADEKIEWLGEYDR
ncbi:MAG: geranylgeranyl reductase family protein [Candidatus Moraniibacteriota bacterium]